MLIKTIIFLSNVFSLVCHSMGIQLYSKAVGVGSIIKTIEVPSITQCYNECWKRSFDCYAIGILPSQLNIENLQSAFCYMLKDDQNQGNIPSINLEVFVSFIAYI